MKSSVKSLQGPVTGSATGARPFSRKPILAPPRDYSGDPDEGHAKGRQPGCGSPRPLHCAAIACKIADQTPFYGHG